MPGVKTRRGEVIEHKKDICPDCGEERKGVLFMQKSKKNCKTCSCGVFDKSGVKIHTFEV